MQIIKTDKAPAAIGPYSQAVDLGSFVYLSGQIPLDPKTGEMPDTIEKQAEQSLKNVGGILEAAGLSFKNVVKTTVFLADLADFSAVNAVYERFFTEPFPARSCIEVAGIPKGAKVEIECIAVRQK